jgi:6-pyruvoyltetrahydropterin/6-carboxytetrahydropterin synthase
VKEMIMYKLNVKSHFSSAHKLVGYDGPCKNLHGHNWEVRIGILCEDTDEIGLTIDFGIVKEDLNEIIEKLDHTLLNDLDYFENCNPTSENIARVLYQELSLKINGDNCKVSDVEIWESDKTSIVYYE